MKYWKKAQDLLRTVFTKHVQHAYLVFNVDEVFCIPDMLYVCLRNGSIHHSTLFAIEKLCTPVVKVGRVRCDGAEELMK